MTWTCPCGQVNEHWGPCASCLNAPPDDIVIPAPRRRLPRALIALALAVALLLTGGVGAVIRVSTDTDGTGAGEAAGGAGRPRLEQSPSDDSSAAAAPADMEELVAELSAFVESARGLAFKEEVDVVLLESADFRARLLDAAEIDPEEIELVGRVLVALGLLDGGIDLTGALEELLGVAVVGFYDPESGELVVRGAEPTPGVRITLVHELTHALQDQHFELHRPELNETDDEVGQAFDGLVEGDAERIAAAYRDSLSDADRKAAEREQVAQAAELGLGADIPRVLIEILTFPYAVGPSFVDALVADGPDRLDAAFADPPTTSEHLLHPERYLAGEPAVEVPPPQAGGDVIDEGVLGELGLLLMLQRAVPPAEAFAAADGWGGDWYVAWDEGDVTCVRAAVAMDTPDDARELRAALDSWAGDHPDARVDAGDTVNFTACA